MDTKTKITSGAITILALATIVLTASLMNQENVYACLEREIAMVCDKLSQANAEGIQTRCYFNETYKVCNEGWVKYSPTEPVNIGEINFTDFSCSDEEFIKECINKDGKVILRVKT